jgi:hypothetical protein
MAVRTLSYRNLTDEQRRLGSKQVRERLMSVMGQPFVTEEQRAAIWQKIEHLSRWERLALG